jgi:CRP/FNR family transcriptional regulator, cyclic AMP receptor protein
MATKRRQLFDAKAFLTEANGGRTIGQYRKNQIIFAQGDTADTIFYLQTGKVKITVVSEQGKEAVVAILRSG